MPPATEPHFVGGPDSLRTLLARVRQQASPALQGQLFVLLALSDAGVPTKAAYLRPTNATNLALAETKDTQALIQKLLGQLPPWQLDPALLTTTDKFALTVVLPLTLGAATEPLPLPYSDEKPIFPLPADFRAARNNPSRYTLRDFLQRQFRYPAQDLRSRVQGTVYVYFEVSETGAVEQRRIAGSLSPTIDAEALRVLKTLPNATTAPRHQGRPVRVAYVVPINLRIQFQ